MVSCNLCSKTFKNQAGLAGHKQLKHRSEVSTPALDQSTPALDQSTPALDQSTPALDQSTTDHSNEYQATTGENILTLITNLSEQLGPILDRLSDEHSTANGCTCDTAREIYQQAVTNLLSLPGLKDALDFYQAQHQHNEEHPAHPVTENWHHVPGVKEAIKEYVTGHAIIHITNGAHEYIEADPSTTDKVRQMIEDIVKR